jgi:hypothetical protein
MVRALVRVVGKPEVIQLDEKSPMLRLARPALQRLLPPGRQRSSFPRGSLRGQRASSQNSSIEVVADLPEGHSLSTRKGELRAAAFMVKASPPLASGKTIEVAVRPRKHSAAMCSR